MTPFLFGYSNYFSYLCTVTKIEETDWYLVLFQKNSFDCENYLLHRYQASFWDILVPDEQLQMPIPPNYALIPVAAPFYAIVA